MINTSEDTSVNVEREPRKGLSDIVREAIGDNPAAKKAIRKMFVFYWLYGFVIGATTLTLFLSLYWGH